MACGRIKKSWEFKHTYRYGKTLVSRNAVIYFSTNKTCVNRLGFSINKKVGKSVKRHRIKRVYREAFCHIQDMIKHGFDFILVARAPAVEMDYHRAKEELLYLCRKGKLLKARELND